MGKWPAVQSLKQTMTEDESGCMNQGHDDLSTLMCVSTAIRGFCRTL